MAQPASVQANGVPGPEVDTEPVDAVQAIKRKRELSDTINGSIEDTPPAKMVIVTDKEKKRIQNYLDALEPYVLFFYSLHISFPDVVGALFCNDPMLIDLHPALIPTHPS
jgi:hypothetical protein